MGSDIVLYLWARKGRRVHSGSQPGHSLTRGLSSQVLAAGLDLSEEEEEEEMGKELFSGPPGGPTWMAAGLTWPRLLYTYQLLHALELVLSRAVRDLLLLSQAGDSALALEYPHLAPRPGGVTP